ncbi:MAG: pyridoxamine 5'-phosphate oxidase [Bdellovibrionales bacterium RBG_16_40_8]|nr:MAG: pyridoxamine 5'-phosphate oxidase [Bdellovibrionales bacterium RBG_16_40_8]
MDGIKKKSRVVEANNFLNRNTPLELFAKWFAEAKSSSLSFPDAFVLSTVGKKSQPNSRVLLLKEIRKNGMIFYTNYQSVKGQEMTANKKVALSFFWDHLFRQVTWHGKVKKISRAESQKYWASRPRESQLSQWVSQQSKPVTSRARLERDLATAKALFADKEIPLPKNWGGYIFIPTYVEFWIGRDGRFHDRYAYLKVENEWRGHRLYP